MANNPRVPDLSWLKLQFNSELFYEKRMENDVNGNPIYVGFAQPGSLVTEAVWYIVKQTYDANESTTHQEVADDIPVFGYVWNDRATYF